MAWVYILKCGDGSFYTGSTVDLDSRLVAHQSGLGSNYTRRHPPVTLVWCEDFDDVEEAFLWEKRIQGWSRAKKQLLIEGKVLELAGWSARQRRRQRITTPPETKVVPE